MRFEQYYLDCLSQASYLIGDETSGLCAIVDPRRDVDEYLADAEANGLRIAYVVETHYHADFLSGHLELAAATGAEIIYGEAADPDFPHRKVVDGERLSLGEVTLEFRTTPGHTLESISIVVSEHPGDAVPYGVLTGDTLFIGDVGRPDLLSAAGFPAEELARMLHESLHNKLLTLPDDTRVYPAHGAGSACGKNLSSATWSTIGEQRQKNYALQPMDVDAFVEAVTAGQSQMPGYFSYDSTLNRKMHPLLDRSQPVVLSLDDVLAARSRGAVILDTRKPEHFARGHLAGSINVGLAGRFAEFCGSVLPPDSEIVLVGDTGTGVEAKVRLGRIGFDRVVGALEAITAALAERPELARTTRRLSVCDLADQLGAAGSDFVLLDVRGAGELERGAIEPSLHIPLSALRERLCELDLEQPLVVYCSGGFRSSIAASLLRDAGAIDVSDLRGGYDEWRSAMAPAT